MLEKYVRQMICDWNAMGRMFGDTALDFYRQKGDKMKLHWCTREIVERELGCNKLAPAPPEVMDD